MAVYLGLVEDNQNNLLSEEVEEIYEEETPAPRWSPTNRKSTRLNSSHTDISRMPSSA